MPKTQLSAHETELLKIALPFAQEQGEVPTQAVLQDKLRCRDKSARNIQHYLLETNAVKVADRVDAIPVRAEDKAVVQHSLGDEQFGTSYSHVVRENLRLRKALDKYGKKSAEEKLQREQDFRDELEALKGLAKQEIGRVPKAVSTPKDTGILLEIATPDLHVGKLAHSIETGGRPYDVKIAIATFERALEALVARTAIYNVEEILLVAGNDLFNSDSPENETTAGTAVSCDGRFHKTFHHVRNMMVKAVERLRQIAKVHVLIVPGNHDRLTAYHLGDSLECYFHADPQVRVTNTPAVRKYVEWGKCLIGFCHGDEGRRTEYAQLMAVENPQAWGRTEYREIHTGHYHKQQLEEFHGVRVRILSALCPADDWHAAQGYIGAVRQAEAFVWSKAEGLLAQVYYNDDAHSVIKTHREIVK
jgi:hypothetical protein